jgi:hypothetical protein
MRIILTNLNLGGDQKKKHAAPRNHDTQQQGQASASARKGTGNKTYAVRTYR